MDLIAEFARKYCREVLIPCEGMQLSANVLYEKYKMHYRVYAFLRGISPDHYLKRPTFYKLVESLMHSLETLGPGAELQRTSQGVCLFNVSLDPCGLGTVNFSIRREGMSFPMEFKINTDSAEQVPSWFYNEPFHLL